jgi:hypothetical protein
MFGRKTVIHESMSTLKWSTLRQVAAAGPLACALALLTTAGCVDPKLDYDDWLARTADARAATPALEAGGSDAALPDAGFGGTYLMACLSSLDPNPAQALLFKADLRFTPAAGGGGTFDFAQTPLLTNAQDVTQVAPMGTPVAVDGSPVAPDGTCDVHIGATTIPTTADPLGLQIVFTDSTLHFHVSAMPLCAALSGHISAPQMTDLDPTRSFCVIRSSTPPFPTFQAADFHCP